MSPKTKKLLVVAAAAVGGYVVYTKVIKAPAAPAVTPIPKAPAAAISSVLTNFKLGTLGGGCF